MSDTGLLLMGEELRACRACLATDVRLEALRPGGLADTYAELTGIQVLPTDGLPQHLCNMCAALLKKSAAFSDKCRKTNTFLQHICNRLQQLGQPSKVEIPMSVIHHLDRTYLKLPYITTNVLNVSLLGDATNLIMYEIPVTEETKTEIEKEESDDDCVLIEDCKDIILEEEPIEQFKREEIFTDLNFTKTENQPTIIAKNDNPVPKLKTMRVGAFKENKKIKEYLIKSKEESCDIHKKQFCNYVLDKYFYRTKESGGADEYDMFDSNADEDTIIKTVDNSSDLCDISVNGNTITDNAELNKTMFLNYIREKYANKMETKKNKKIVDLLRSKIGKLKSDKRFRTKEDLDEFAKTYNFDVIRMTRNEQILELERSRKNALSYLQLTWKCEECFRGFTTETLYKRHMTVHDPVSGSYVCEVCRHRFSTSKKLNDHMGRHKIKFVCRTCQLTFKSSHTAREHYNTHAGVTYECQYCNVKFRRYASRVNHIRIHHGATQCEICYGGFQGAYGLSQHKMRSHKQTYQCASCNVHFDNADAMLKHIGSSPDGACDPNVRACAKCGERFDGGEQFDEHVAELHVVTREKQRKRRAQGKPTGNRKKTSRWVKCCTCPNFEHGGGHKVPKSDNAPNSDSCPCSNDDGDECLCPKGSERSCGLTEQGDPTNKVDRFLRHKWAHKGCCKERRLMRSCVMCEACGTVFQDENKLRTHQLIHTGEKPFQCDECPKRFRLKVALQTHMNMHTGERPYKCSLCPKAFTSVENKIRHNLVHTKERRHRCEVCDKMFQMPSCVRAHVRTVHMKIPQPPRVRNRKRKCE